MNSGALLNRMNFALTLSGGRMRGVGPGREAGAGGAEEARRALVTTALAGDLSDATATTAAKATTPAQAVALILGSPEFQKR